MKKKKVFALMMAKQHLHYHWQAAEDLRQVIQNHQDLQTAVL